MKARRLAGFFTCVTALATAPRQLPARHNRYDAGSRPRNLGCEINSASDEGAATIRPGTGELVFMSTRSAPGVDTWSLWSAPLPGWLR